MADSGRTYLMCATVHSLTELLPAALHNRSTSSSGMGGRRTSSASSGSLPSSTACMAVFAFLIDLLR